MKCNQNAWHTQIDLKFILGLTILLVHDVVNGQDFAWAMQFGSSQYDAVTNVTTDNVGNVIVTGAVQGTMDIDPGAGVLNVTSNGSSDVFVGKYTASGSLLWAFSLGSAQFESASTIWVDNDNNIYVGGGFRLTVDFDPGSEIFNMTSAGHLDIFILKLDPDGNFLWAKQIGGIEEDSVEGITTDLNNDLLVTGLFYGTVDFDPNSGVQNLVPTGAQDAYILKWTENGEYIWAKKFGTTSGEIPYDIVTDENGVLYATGLFWGNLDFDPNAGTFNLNAGSFNSKGFVLKWNSDGTFIWAGMFGGSQGSAAYELELNAAGDITVVGSFAGTGDFDPGAGTFNLIGDANPLYHNIFILKLSNVGNFLWAKNIGADGTNQAAYAVAVTPSSEIWVGGFFSGTVDFDPSAGVSSFTVAGSSDGFVLQMDENGNHLFSGVIGGALDDYCNTVALFGGSALYAGGLFTWNNADLNPTTGINIVASNSNTNDGYVIKLGLLSCEVSFAETEITICENDGVLIDGNWINTAGVYTDHLINMAGCDSIVEITLNVFPALEIAVAATAAPCNTAVGSALALATGVGSFEYLWNDPLQQTNATAVDLLAGWYTVTVTDANGCIEAAWIDVPSMDDCVGDYNLDGVVNVYDLLQFVAFIGCSENCCPYDGDLNGFVNVSDLLIMIAAFGNVCD